jgi:hypothetical protein
VLSLARDMTLDVILKNGLGIVERLATLARRYK